MTTYQADSKTGHEEFAHVVHDALRHGEVVLTQNGQPVARVLPMTAASS